VAHTHDRGIFSISGIKTGWDPVVAAVRVGLTPPSDLTFPNSRGSTSSGHQHHWATVFKSYRGGHPSHDYVMVHGSYVGAERTNSRANHVLPQHLLRERASSCATGVLPTVGSVETFHHRSDCTRRSIGLQGLTRTERGKLIDRIY
jgi:hypothetical protein